MSSTANNVHGSLYEAQRAVMREVKYVQKQKSAQLGYAVATEADVIGALRDSMIQNGIVVAPVGVTMMDSRQWDNPKGGGGQVLNVRLAVTFRFAHVETKDFQDVVAAGEAQSFSDKACAAAMTMAQKYAMLEFFLLERGTDPEMVHEHRDEPNAENWAMAVASLTKVVSEQSLNNVMEKIRKDTSNFSDENITELAMYAERRRLEIRKSDARGDLRQWNS